MHGDQIAQTLLNHKLKMLLPVHNSSKQCLTTNLQLVLSPQEVSNIKKRSRSYGRSGLTVHIQQKTKHRFSFSSYIHNWQSCMTCSSSVLLLNISNLINFLQLLQLFMPSWNFECLRRLKIQDCRKRVHVSNRKHLLYALPWPLASPIFSIPSL